MGLYEKIQELCDDRGIAITALEKELGWGRGSIGKLKKGGSTSTDRLQALAEYFQVSADFLLEVQNSGHENGDGWYINKETAKAAQEAFDDPNLRILFDAARGSRPEDIQMAAEMLARLKRTNPDG